MNLEVKKLLQDIFDSIALIEAHLHDIPTLSTYTNDLKTIDAVERRLSIIGEALWKADKIDPAIVISNRKRIISLRHIIVHDYNLIEDATIWMICKSHLPVLKNEIQTILNTKINVQSLKLSWF